MENNDVAIESDLKTVTPAYYTTEPELTNLVFIP
jgi:hypothetical protein